MCRRGKSSGINPVSTRVPAIATANPSAPPSTDSSRLSDSTWPIRLRALAPSARRTAISRRRTIARASSRLATFAQPISRTAAAAATSIIKSESAEPTMSSRSGVRRVRHFEFERGYRCSDCAATRLRSFDASASVTPGFSRPIAFMKCALRIGCFGSNHVGVQASTVSPCGSER
jgi:hypothetical protein